MDRCCFEAEGLFSSFESDSSSDSNLEQSYDEIQSTPIIILSTSSLDKAEDLNITEPQEMQEEVDKLTDMQSFANHYENSFLEMNIYSRPIFTTSVNRPSYAPYRSSFSCWNLWGRRCRV